jgi:hypothetical protein
MASSIPDLSPPIPRAARPIRLDPAPPNSTEAKTRTNPPRSGWVGRLTIAGAQRVQRGGGAGRRELRSGVPPRMVARWFKGSSNIAESGLNSSALAQPQGLSAQRGALVARSRLAWCEDSSPGDPHQFQMLITGTFRDEDERTGPVAAGQVERRDQPPPNRLDVLLTVVRPRLASHPDHPCRISGVHFHLLRSSAIRWTPHRRP